MEQAQTRHRELVETGAFPAACSGKPGGLLVHAETSLHLPFFYHRKQGAEQDFGFIAPRAEGAADWRAKNRARRRCA
jgi:hypothetical protein